jgi:phosphoglycolate phosphatase
VTSLIGYPLDIMFKGVGVSDDKIWDFVATYKDEYIKISTQKTTLLPHAKEAILSASKFATLGIVTTKTGRYSEILMHHFDLMQYFDVLIGREHVEYPKPHAQPILKAIEKLDTQGKEIWMIGDTKLDLICAKEAGVNSIGVLSGYGEKDTLKNFTDIIFNDTLQAVNYLKSRKK